MKRESSIRRCLRTMFPSLWRSSESDRPDALVPDGGEHRGDHRSGAINAYIAESARV